MTDTNASPPPASPKKAAPSADAKWLPVRSITFNSQMPIPGTSTATVLRGDETQANKPRWLIDYGPQLRHFRIQYMTADASKEAEVRMVPEASVKCWEPG